METVIVSNSQFYSHYPRQIPKGSVNAEQVEIRLDKSWDGLTVRIHWLNVASNVERKPLLERDKPNTIPWEVLTDLGELRMGLVGLDGETVIKPTIWLTYGYVVDGVDPESGSDPQPPTPSWEQQMVEQATQANQAAQAAQKASEEAAKSVASAGPYAQAAKDAAEAAKASQDASATSARQANEAAQAAKDAAGSIGDSVDRAEDAATEAGKAKQAAETAQAAASNSAGAAQGAATTASEAAHTAQEAATQAGEYLATVKQDANNAESAALEAGKSKEAARDAAQEAANARDQANTAATSADTAKNAAEQAATTAGAAQSGAAQSAQAAERAKQEAQNAAAAFPAPSPEVAGMVPVVNPEGNGYIFGEAGGGGAGGELLLAEYIHRGNQEIYPSSIDWATGVIECTEPHGLNAETAIMIVPNDWEKIVPDFAAKYIPLEWSSYQETLYVVPVSETSLKIVGSDKQTVITVDPSNSYNTEISIQNIHFEVPVGWKIDGLPETTLSVRLRIMGFVRGEIYRYLQFKATMGGTWQYIHIFKLPSFGVSRPKHMVFSVWDLSIEAFNYGASSVNGVIYNKGRRSNNLAGFSDVGTEQIVSVAPLAPNSQYNYGVFGVRNPNNYASFSNGTIVRIYEKGGYK